MRARRVAAVFGALVCVLSPVSAARAAGESSAKQIIAHVSGERHFANIPSVKEDPGLSAGCALHTRYLELNGFGNDPHHEVKGRPGYTAAGAKAASQSDLAELTAFNGSPWSQGDPFDVAPYHLLELMNPIAKTMGANERITRSGLAIECVNVLGGQRRAPGRRVQVWEFPGPGPLPDRFTFLEGPRAGSPTGVWLFFFVLPPRGQQVTLSSLRVSGPHHRKVTALTTFLTGGLRDGRAAARAADLSRGFFSPEPAAGLLLPILSYGPYDWLMTLRPRGSYEGGFRVSG